MGRSLHKELNGRGLTLTSLLVGKAGLSTNRVANVLLLANRQAKQISNCVLETGFNQREFGRRNRNFVEELDCEIRRLVSAPRRTLYFLASFFALIANFGRLETSGLSMLPRSGSRRHKTEAFARDTDFFLHTTDYQ